MAEIAAFGARMRARRKDLHLTLDELAAHSGLSKGYLSELETGKRKKAFTVKTVERIAAALRCAPDALLSDRGATAGGTSEIPDNVELFGLSSASLDAALAELAQPKMTVEQRRHVLAVVSRTHGIGAEHLCRAAVRVVTEVSGNFDRTVEKAADEFRQRMPDVPDPALWAAALASELGRLEWSVDDSRMSGLPSLRRLRLIRPTEGPRTVYVQRGLSPQQLLFVLAREIGYEKLGLAERSLVYPPDSETSFNQVMNDARASYFAAALLVPTATLQTGMQDFFKLRQWDSGQFEQLLDPHLLLATTETVMYRFSQVLTRFDLRPHFLKISLANKRFRLEKQLNLSALRVPAGINRDEHFCGRWLGTRLLKELDARPDQNRMIDAQVSHFETGAAFFGMSVAIRRSPRELVSYTVGVRRMAAAAEAIEFIPDRDVKSFDVGGSCERCAIANCVERAEKPTWLSYDRDLKALSGTG